MSKKKKKNTERRLGLFGLIMLLANLVATVLLLLSICAGFFKPSQVPFVAFLGIIFPYLFLLQILFLIFFIIKRSSFVLISIISIIISFPSCQKIWTAGKTKNDDENTLKIISFNVKNLTSKNNLNQEESIANFYEYLQESQSDVINLQEYNLYDVQKDLDKLKKITNMKHVAYTNYYPNNPFLSIITLSKYPIIAIESIRANQKSYAIASNIVVKEDTIKIVNVHLQSIHLDLEEINSIPNSAEVAKVLSKKIYGQVTYASKKREKQVETLLKNIGDSPKKTILCGDFNDTPNSYTYRQFSKIMTDTFVESGRGFGFTFNELPLLRIDYMFTSRDIKPLSFIIDRKSDLSDHDIIIGKVAL